MRVHTSLGDERWRPCRERISEQRGAGEGNRRVWVTETGGDTETRRAFLSSRPCPSTAQSQPCGVYLYGSLSRPLGHEDRNKNLRPSDL